MAVHQWVTCYLCFRSLNRRKTFVCLMHKLHKFLQDHDCKGKRFNLPACHTFFQVTSNPFIINVAKTGIDLTVCFLYTYWMIVSEWSGLMNTNVRYLFIVSTEILKILKNQKCCLAWYSSRLFTNTSPKASSHFFGQCAKSQLENDFQTFQ